MSDIRGICIYAHDLFNFLWIYLDLYRYFTGIIDNYTFIYIYRYFTGIIDNYTLTLLTLGLRNTYKDLTSTNFYRPASVVLG